VLCVIELLPWPFSWQGAQVRAFGSQSPLASRRLVEHHGFGCVVGAGPCRIRIARRANGRSRGECICGDSAPVVWHFRHAGLSCGLPVIPRRWRFHSTREVVRTRKPGRGDSGAIAELEPILGACGTRRRPSRGELVRTVLLPGRRHGSATFFRTFPSGLRERMPGFPRQASSFKRLLVQHRGCEPLTR